MKKNDTTYTLFLLDVFDINIGIRKISKILKYITIDEKIVNFEKIINTQIPIIYRLSIFSKKTILLYKDLFFNRIRTKIILKKRPIS